MRRLVTFVLIPLALATLAGCAARYKPDSGWGGGFSDTQLDKNLFRVVYNGTGNARTERVEEWALLRASELTLKHGFSYFAITDGGTREDVSTYVTPVESTTEARRTKRGNVVMSTTTTGGDTITTVRPTTTYTFLTYHRKPTNVAMAYDAEFLCRTLGEKYKVVCGADHAKRR